MGYKTFPSRFKACHQLGPGSSNRPAAVIVKFIFFDEKNETYGRKSWLANQKNPINGRKIFLRERLPPCQKEILDHALKENLITSTINCQIKVFRKDEEGKFKSVLVKSKKAVDDIKQVAVKKIPRQQPITTNASGKTPLPESSVQTPNAAIKRSEKDYHTVLKRLRESPGDGVNVLKSFCMDSSAVTSNDDFQETDPTFSGQNK